GDAQPKSELVGAWAYVRDFLEWTSQKWERHVVGYDFNQQVSLFQALTNRKGSTFFSQKWGRPRYGVLAAILAAAAGGLGLYLYRRRRRRQARDGEQRGDPRSPSALLATELYERLDAAMSQKGIA